MDRGEKKRFEQLMLPHLGSAYGYAKWLAKSEAEAQDLVQEVYLRAMQYFHSFKGQDARVWLMTIVRNTWFTWHQRKRAEGEGHGYEDEAPLNGAVSEIYPAANHYTPEYLHEQATLSRLVNEAIQSLPDDFREVILLREMEDLSYKEIATILDLPMGTVMSRLSRARESLQDILRPQIDRGYET